MLEVAGAAIGAASTVIGGMNAAAQSEAAAAMLKRQAQIRFGQGLLQEGDVREQTNQTIGQQIAGAGGSGVTLQGSPTDVIGSAASDAAQKIGVIGWGTNLDTGELKYQADLAKVKASNQRANAFMGGASQLASGLARIGGPAGPTSAKKQDQQFASQA